VLLAISPVLVSRHGQLTSGTGASPVRLELPADIPAAVLRAFVLYLYRGAVTVTQASVRDFLRLAHIFQFDQLRECCADFVAFANMGNVTIDSTEDLIISTNISQSVSNLVGEYINEDMAALPLSPETPSPGRMLRKKTTSSAVKSRHLYGTRSALIDKVAADQEVEESNSKSKDGSTKSKFASNSKSKEPSPKFNDAGLHITSNRKLSQADRTKVENALKQAITTVQASAADGEEGNFDHIVSDLLSVYDWNMKQSLEGDGSQSSKLKSAAALVGPESKVTKTESDGDLVTGSGMQRAVFEKPRRGRPPKGTPATTPKGKRGRPRFV
jgi:hypothetical protein